MSHFVAFLIGALVGVGVATWGFLSVPRAARKILTTPPKDR